MIDSVESIAHIEALLKSYGPYLSLSEAARQVGVSLQTLSSAVHSGRIPALTMSDGRKYVRLDTVVRAFGKDRDKSLIWQQKLMAAGLALEVKPHVSRTLASGANEAIEIQGEPISSTVIRERR